MLDRRIAYPDFKVPMLKWWEGIYDHVFIALYPFYRIRREGSEKSEESDLSDYEDLLVPRDRPADFEDVVKQRGEAVSWRSVHSAVAPEVPEAIFYRAVWLSAALGFSKRANVELQKRIDTYSEAQKLYLPATDALPKLLHGTVHRFLCALDADTVTVWDEFRDHSFTVPISVFAPDQPAYWLPEAITGNGVWAVHLPDPGLLICCEFDGAEAMIAMTDRALEIARPEEYFEGRYADAATYCDWLNPPDFFEREQ